MPKVETKDGLMLDGLALADYEDGGCWLIVLDDWQISVILSSLRYAHWLARWSNLGPYTWDELEAKITQMEHCLMAGCDVDLLLDKFDGLISAIQELTLTCNPQITVEPASPDVNVTCAPDVSVNCGTGGGSTGGGYGGPFGIDPDPDPGQPAPGEPPESWTDPPEDYDAYKCKAANVLVLNLAEFLATCNVLVLKDYSVFEEDQDIIDYISTTLTNASAWLSHILSSASVEISRALSCAASGRVCGSPAAGGEVTFGATTSFADVRLSLLNDRTEAVCELYDAQTVDAARTAITNRLSGYLAEGTYSADEQTTFLYSLSNYLSNVWLNRLFVKDSQVASYSDVSAVDCGECGAECVGSDTTDWVAEFGTFLIQDGETLRIEPELVGGYYYAGAILNITPMALSNLALSISSSHAIPFVISAYSYSESVPYPGQSIELSQQTQTPPLVVNLPFTDPTEATQVYLEIRPTSTNTSFSWIELSGICLS
jgi:hypothetical protein